ncbi:MAG: hypothetical protein CMO01_19850 [Thalassobius sp.]|nr:hypothetical protein [Thalassovita sp.]
MTHHFLSYLIPFVILSILSCSKKSDVVEKPDYTKLVGYINGSCIAIKNPNVKSGSKLLVINIDDQSKTITTSTGETITADESCFPLHPDRIDVNKNPETYFYKIEEAEADMSLRIGLLVDQLSSENPMDIDNDGTEEVFNYCLTTEGVKFTIESQKDTLWSAYYYLGYDVESTCP